MDRLHKLTIEDWGGVKSPSFKSFARKFKNDLRKELASIGATLTAWNTGHYYVSGFFRTDGGKCYYFSISDVRYFSLEKMLFRTAKDEKDYTGGVNQYVKIQTGMAEAMGLPKTKWKAQVGGTGEWVWSENAMVYDTKEEVKDYLDGLSMRWFRYWCSRIVPENTPNREEIDPEDRTIYQWFK